MSLPRDSSGPPRARVKPLTKPRNVIAVCRFRGAPGQETEAAEAWAFELTYCFLRGVGEAPRVEYSDGVYTCTGLMTTTHPGDSPVTQINGGEPSNLNSAYSPHRQKVLRDMYPQRIYRFDGRDPR